MHFCSPNSYSELKMHESLASSPTPPHPQIVSSTPPQPGSSYPTTGAQLLPALEEKSREGELAKVGHSAKAKPGRPAWRNLGRIDRRSEFRRALRVAGSERNLKGSRPGPQAAFRGRCFNPEHSFPAGSGQQLGWGESIWTGDSPPPPKYGTEGRSSGCEAPAVAAAAGGGRILKRCKMWIAQRGQDVGGPAKADGNWGEGGKPPSPTLPPPLKAEVPHLCAVSALHSPPTPVGGNKSSLCHPILTPTKDFRLLLCLLAPPTFAFICTPGNHLQPLQLRCTVAEKVQSHFAAGWGGGTGRKGGNSQSDVTQLQRHSGPSLGFEVLLI